MKKNKLKRKHFIFLLGILLVSYFVAFKAVRRYVLSEDIHISESKGLQIKTDHSRIKAECVEKATQWLVNCSVDPIELEKKEMKGKKHFLEKLFAFYQLYLHTTDSSKKEIYRKILKQMFKVTDNADYHLINDDESRFKSEIVSYLHACYLMEQLGFDSHKYKGCIKKLLPRIERHLPVRNASVQMTIAYFLRELGYETENAFTRIFKNTLIYNIKGLGTVNVFDFEFNSSMLGVCHEIFALSEYGRKKINLLTKEKKAYLKNIIKSSIEQIISSGDIRYLDLLAEMLVSLNYLGCDNLPEYKRGVSFIINCQNENGSFGDYERFRSYFAQQGIDIDIKWYLHSTVVCLWALLPSLQL